MYVPENFAVADETVLHQFIGRYDFALLVTAAGGVPTASHLPILLETESSGAVLKGHMARANPQWQEFPSIDEALVIFQGPHAYVSPSWYASAPMVPTWNYTAVHAYGKPALIDDAAAARDHLARLADRHEKDRETPWSLDGVPADFIANMQQAIVAFEIPIDRLEGKFKLSQNRKAVDRDGARRALADSGDADAMAVAALMTDGEGT
jgi:transcriptional regulator